MEFEGQITNIIQFFSCEDCGVKIFISNMEDPEINDEPIIKCSNCISEISKKMLIKKQYY
jgi:hypothetical protein